MLAFTFMARKDIAKLLGRGMDRYSLAIVAAIIAFFLIFSLLYVSPVEQLYFDENIYQGIALNILNHGNSLWCQFGTGYVKTCYINALYHDPVGWAAFLAIAFALFGIGTQTAYALELLCGALSILFVFLLASVLWERRSFAVLASLAMAVMPNLFVWARTQADFDLPFMMLAVLSFFFFVVFVKRKNLYTLGSFAFTLALTSYMRIEAILLVPVFFVLMLAFGEKGIWETFHSRLKEIMKTFAENTAALVVLLVFIVALLPQIYYVTAEAQQPSYGQSAAQAVISLSNFQNNIGVNTSFLLGQLNGISYYPTVFHYAIFPLGVVGAAALLLRRKTKNRFGILLLLGLWFLTYFLFYTSFYAGSVLYGVDSRFMLQLLPALCLLAAYALVGVGDVAVLAVSKIARKSRSGSMDKAVFYLTSAAAAIALLIVPFAFLIPIVTLPPGQMPQQTVILGAANTFYREYTAVPANCLVFSFTPDIWYEVNRSSAQFNYLLGSNETLRGLISNYSCLVIDYGYWCVVPPYHSTVCAYALKRFATENLTPVSENGSTVAFYKILNYS